MSDKYRTRNIQTKDKIIQSKTSAYNIGGQVPAGKTRYVTFLYLSPGYAGVGLSAAKVYLASVGVSDPSRASLVATTYRKDVLQVHVSGYSYTTKKGPVMRGGGPLLYYPDKIDPDAPLFTIAGGKWLGAFLSHCSAADIMVQWFDE